MRSDMYEVLIERPRGGAGWGRDWPRFNWRWAANCAQWEAEAHVGTANTATRSSSPILQTEPSDDDPINPPTTIAAAVLREDVALAAAARHWADGGPTKLRMGPRQRSKWLSENLSPLRRFLLRRVGHPWNQVHAEICAHIRLSSAVQKHVLDHLWHYVERHPVFIDNWPHHAQARRYGRSEGHGYSPLSDYGRSFYVCPDTGTLQHARRLPRRVRSDVAIAQGPS